MKTVENPGGFVFRPDIKVPTALVRKKTGGSAFMSLFRQSDEADASHGSGSDGAGLDPVVLETQVDRIHELGQLLLKMQTLEQVKAYKAAIRALLERFVKYGLSAEELVSNRSVMNQKKYTIIKVIDEKLEKLVTGILQSQAKQLDILSRLEEIQGLLVDLIH